MKTLHKIPTIFLLLTLFAIKTQAQEIVVPLSQNTIYSNHAIKPFKSKKERAVLPFIDDFSYNGPYPDATLWQDSQAFVNNTMSANPITRGVATLDGLNKIGRPYYPLPFNSGLADSLTSVDINLLPYDSSNHIYFSFYYQPQGLGFSPEIGDSLFLYFKNDLNQWVRVWQVRGTTYQAFKFVILPVMDEQFLHADFQFRFVNIASLNTNDDVWNLDYIKLDKNRNEDDTLVNDIAFSVDPSSILKPYNSLPYRHFLANQANEKSATQVVKINNLYSTPKDIICQLVATELISGSSINNQILPIYNIAAKDVAQLSFSSYPISYTAPNNKSKVVIRNKYFYSQVATADLLQNDTIVNDAIFDNYFAYDDGSAEKSYFLLPAINFPSKTALQFTLNEADTLRGLMVHFGPQAPTALGKYFSIVVYKSLGSLGQSDSIILQEDLFKVQYEPSYNGFSSYAFGSPILLGVGSYYIGITQPTNFGSDSIYYGLDVNTNSSLQYLAYNVEGTWYSSTVNGSVMMRPIVGQEFVPTGVQNIVKTNVKKFTVFPNPTADMLQIKAEDSYTKCFIYSMNGKLQCIELIKNATLDVSMLQVGDYILVFSDSKGNTISKKINKL